MEQKRQFTVHDRMFCVTKLELAQDIPKRDLDEVWESLELAPCDTCEFFSNELCHSYTKR